MQFRTPIDPMPLKQRLGYAQHGLALGSCFADRIGARMERCKLPVTVNPSGVLFNPASIASTLHRYVSGEPYGLQDLQPCGERWVSLDHHSSLASASRDVALDNINQATQQGHTALMQSDYLMLTLGSAWVYRLKSNGRVVCNCHKLPAETFVRERLSVEEIVEALGSLLDHELRGRTVIWTVSPVRHLGDGLSDNALSKATLLLAVRRLCELYATSHYFPSYEIMVDDLRDYRFYERDMVHPSDVAVDYIWERFCADCMDPVAVARFPQIEALHQAMAHRPTDPQGEAYHAFRRQMAVRARALQQAYSEVDLTDEIAFFES